MIIITTVALLPFYLVVKRYAMRVARLEAAVLTMMERQETLKLFATTILTAYILDTNTNNNNNNNSSTDMTREELVNFDRWYKTQIVLQQMVLEQLLSNIKAVGGREGSKVEDGLISSSSSSSSFNKMGDETSAVMPTNDETPSSKAKRRKLRSLGAPLFRFKSRDASNNNGSSSQDNSKNNKGDPMMEERRQLERIAKLPPPVTKRHHVALESWLKQQRDQLEEQLRKTFSSSTDDD